MNIYYLIILSLSLSTVYAKDIDFTILHTNDLHSYIGGIGPDTLFTNKANDADPVLGHYSRLTTAIKLQKQKLNKRNEPYLLLDAGDFYAGTLFQLLGPDEKVPVIPELEFFTFNEYDFSILGNHEFDAKDIGLFNMLSKINDSKKDFKILSSNMIFNNKDSKLKEFHKLYEGINHNKLLTDIYIKTITDGNNNLKVGFIGILGPNGAKVSTANRSDISFIGHNDKKVKDEFEKLYGHLQEKVDILKNKYKAEVIILTMHAGTPEDEMIAKNVTGIDVIIAGHTHDLYIKPKIVDDTIISQVKCYGNYLGKLSLNFNNKKVNLKTGKTYIEINDSISTDLEYDKKIDSYIKFINLKTKKYGYQYDSPIFKTSESKKRIFNQSHNKLGKVIASGIKQEFNLQKDKKTPPIDFFFTTIGLIRSDILAPIKNTPYQFSDTFKFLPLGISSNGEPGFPIVTFYMHKNDVRLLINFLEIYKMVSSKYNPVFSDDIQYVVNKWGIPQFNRLKNLTLRGQEFNKWPKFIHLATTSYIAAHVDAAGPMSYGLVNFSAHDKDGNKVNKPTYSDLKGFKLLSDYLKKLKVLQ
jgi:5'-nucleotidase/UDP-sugar diphosphatase